MVRKNIILIEGRDTYGCDQERKRLTDAFSERRSEYNITHIWSDEVKDWKNISQDMLSFGLFSEKRMFVIHGSDSPVSEEKEEASGEKENKKLQKLKETEDTLINLCIDVPDDHFLLFCGFSFRKGSKLSGWLHDNGDVRKFDNIWSRPLWEERFPHIEKRIREGILKEYERIAEKSEEILSDLSYEIYQTFEKISLMPENTLSREENFSELVSLDARGKIFDLIDALSRENAKKALSLFRSIKEFTNIHALLASIIALFRPIVYILFLKKQGISEKQIQGLLPIHPYVIQKAYSTHGRYEKIWKFYDTLLSINTAYKSGKGFQDGELGRILEIELAIMELKK